MVETTHSVEIRWHGRGGQGAVTSADQLITGDEKSRNGLSSSIISLESTRRFSLLSDN